MSAELMDLCTGITPQQLAMLRALETWRVKKIRGKWTVCGQAKCHHAALTWLEFKGLIRADYKPNIPEMQITGLGHQLLALKSPTAKPAAASHQEKAA